MSLAKNIMSAILAVGMCIMPFAEVTASAVNDEKNVYVYDSTISEKSKVPDSESEQPFNVFDIYNAYYEMISQTTAPVTSAATTTADTATTAAISSTKKTTAKNTTTKKLTTTTKKNTTITKTTTENTTSQSASTSAVTTSETTAATTTVVTTQLGQFPNGEYINGIDVSQWQYIIDWQAVKNSGQVDYAIIKAGWGKYADQVDPFFKTNMEQAQAAGLDVGVYWFSYAMSVEEAKQEALACLEVIDGYSFNYPIYYDFEYYAALNNLSYATLSAMIETFCTTLQEHGYYAGVYGSGSDFEYRIYRHVLDKYPVWVAEYDTPTLTWYKGTHGMWQYSPKGRIDGIDCDVDLNYCYVDYPSIIGVNPAGGKIPETTVTTTETTTTADPITTTAVSEIYNGKIVELDASAVYDWSDFDKDTYDFAMIQAEKDEIELIGENIDAAHKLGINCGIIYDCRTVTVAGIKEEAVAIDSQLTGRMLEYPLYLGFTEKNSDFKLYGFEKDKATSVAAEFCSYFENRKYFVGIMAEDKALKYRFSYDLLSRYDIWQVKYNNDPSLYAGSCGITTRFDREPNIISTRDYLDVMKHNGLNGYPKEESENK
ncbi:MAG: hypothetical protein IKK66_09025 [Ruminococcus sp.]|nr:hypothetical protein [Ruminococcus sp.]